MRSFPADALTARRRERWACPLLAHRDVAVPPRPVARSRARLLVALVLLAVVVGLGAFAARSPALVVPLARIGIQVERAVFWLEAPVEGDPSPFLSRVPRTGAVVERSTVRLLRPSPPTPRRVAVQAGHWKTIEAPAEFPRLRTETGASVDGVDEVDVTLDIAERVARVLAERGITVDVLPATIPPGYLADVFVALHADDDASRQTRGFKMAHGFYRGPHEAQLVRALREAYSAATGLPWDDQITENMLDYYAFAWYRYEHALAPHTAATIIEMGFLSNREDRKVLLDQADVVARAIADGVSRFLREVPQSALFAEDIVVPIATPPRRE